MSVIKFTHHGRKAVERFAEELRIFQKNHCDGINSISIPSMDEIISDLENVFVDRPDMKTLTYEAVLTIEDEKVLRLYAPRDFYLDVPVVTEAMRRAYSDTLRAEAETYKTTASKLPNDCHSLDLMLRMAEKEAECLAAAEIVLTTDSPSTLELIYKAQKGDYLLS